MSLRKPFQASPIQLGEVYRRRQRLREWRKAAIIIGRAIVGGIVIGFLTAPGDDGEMIGVAMVKQMFDHPQNMQAEYGAGTSNEGTRSVYYPYCRHARTAGAAPILRGQPGYRPELDADGDGVACEPYVGSAINGWRQRLILR